MPVTTRLRCTTCAVAYQKAARTRVLQAATANGYWNFADALQKPCVYGLQAYAATLSLINLVSVSPGLHHHSQRASHVAGCRKLSK